MSADVHTDSAAEGSLAQAFTAEHHDIDAGIEQYLADKSTDDPVQRAQPLVTALQALRRHIYLEEEVVFPHLPKGALMMPMMVMRKEHGELWQRMDALEETLRSPSSDHSGVEQACTEILTLLDRHNMKEEPVIYPHMDADLSESEQEKVRDLLSGGEMPAGWVCEALR